MGRQKDKEDDYLFLFHKNYIWAYYGGIKIYLFTNHLRSYKCNQIDNAQFHHCLRTNY